MRRLVACILILIYSGFTAGAAWYVPTAESVDSTSVENFYDYNISECENDKSTSSPHIEVLNFHKHHKHLAASRTYKVPRITVTTVSSPIYIFPSIIDYRHKAMSILPGTSQTCIFIKNRVLLI